MIDLDALVRQLLIGISSGMVLYIVAAGIALTIGLMNLINFAQGGFYMLGAFLCFYMVPRIGFWWTLLLVPIIVALIGGIVEIFILRPIYRKGFLFQMLLTMGLTFVMIAVMEFIWGKMYKVVSIPEVLSSFLPIMGIDFPVYYIFIIIVSGLFALGLWFMFDRTRLGMTCRAIISDRSMVGHLGINVPFFCTVIFMISIWLSGIAGVIMAPLIAINSQNAISTLFSVFVVLIVGGLTSMRGVFFAALVVGVVNSIGVMYLPWFYTLLPATIMILVLLFKPEGLFEKRED